MHTVLGIPLLRLLYTLSLPSDVSWYFVPLNSPLPLVFSVQWMQSNHRLSKAIHSFSYPPVSITICCREFWAKQKTWHSVLVVLTATPHQAGLVRVISSWPDASPLKAICVGLANSANYPDQRSDANCTVKGEAFSFAVRWRCSLARFPKRPSHSFYQRVYGCQSSVLSNSKVYISTSFIIWWRCYMMIL